MKQAARTTLAVATGAAAALLLILPLAPGLRSVSAQSRLTYPLSSHENGDVALGLALRKLTTSGTFMQAPAHPDDETNALFAYFGYGMGLRVVDVQNNRGDGGQNEIGPELFRDIAVLRTSELLGAHSIDGAEQYFTRAIDYGYSFSPEEVIEKWGRKDIVGDYVRLIRTLRPDVVITMNIQGRGGDRAHEATTILTHEGFLAAGDPTKYPEQIAEGLRPWQPKKLYFSGGGGVVPAAGRGAAEAPGAAAAPEVHLTAVPTGMYDALLGRTYQEIGNDARSFHKCQGAGGGGGGGRGGPAGRGAAAGRGGGFGGGGYRLMETSIPGEKGKAETDVFEGIDTTLAGIAQYAGPEPPENLRKALESIQNAGRLAQTAPHDHNPNLAGPIEDGLTRIRALRSQLGSMGLSDSARYEIDFRLKIKERDYEDAVLIAHGLAFDALADDGLVVDGQPIRVNVSATNHGQPDVAIDSVSVAGFDSPSTCKSAQVTSAAAFTCSVEAKIPANAKSTTPYFHDNYWAHPANQAIQIFDPGVPFGVPFAPTPFRVTFHVKAGSVEIAREIPVHFRYVKDPFVGEKRMELNVVPAFSASVSPSMVVIPESAAASRREVYIAVTNGTKGAAGAQVALELPSGWKADPATAPLKFTHEDEALSARFQITAPAGAKLGSYSLKAVVTSPAMPGQRFTDGYHEIEYPHIERRQIMKPAEAALKVVDVKTVPNRNVGYIAGVGDQVPAALEQLGAKVTFIDPDQLAWGDLSKFDVIITGVRAYERRADLRAYNARLLDYAKSGGTVIVQYNKMEFNQAEYGPYPAKVSGNRVSDEDVPVKILSTDDPVFTTPNVVGPAAWANWVQERGLYFLGDKDKRYTDLVSMTDSFKDNPGEKLGSFVEAKDGDGYWFYLGLGLWRQLPAGTEGAYQLLANLIARGHAPAAKAQAPGNR